MFDPQAKQVVFVPAGRNSTFSDPSYQLSAYYELWARWADKDNQFWTDAASASRLLFHQAADPHTGLMPDYANFDGTPATTPEIGKPFVQALWDATIPSGTWRYYDGMLYMLGLLHVSGKFHAS